MKFELLTKKSKRFFKGMLAFVLVLSFVLTISPVKVDAALDAPATTSTMNLKNKQYDFYGTASVSTLYTNYWFTKTSALNISVTNKSTKNNLTVKIVKYNTTIFGIRADSTVQTVTVPANGTTTWKLSVSSSDKYYIKFIAPSNFEGYVKG